MSPYKDHAKHLVHGKEYYQLNHEKFLEKSRLQYQQIRNDPIMHEKEKRRKRNLYWNNIEQRRAEANQYYNSEEQKKKKSEYAKKWNREHLQEQTAKRRYRRQNCRLKVYAHYSKGTMKCAKCGFGDVRALSIDHINGGGRLHKRQEVGSHLEEWLVRNNYPEGFQVLCMNCQFIKRVENNEEGSNIKSSVNEVQLFNLVDDILIGQ